MPPAPDPRSGGVTLLVLAEKPIGMQPVSTAIKVQQTKRFIPRSDGARGRT